MGKPLDDRKLKMIKVKVLEIEKANVIRKDPKSEIEKNIKNYIAKVVDGKC